MFVIVWILSGILGMFLYYKTWGEHNLKLGELIGLLMSSCLGFLTLLFGVTFYYDKFWSIKVKKLLNTPISNLKEKIWKN